MRMLLIRTSVYDIIMQEPVKNEVTTINIESAGIHLLNNHSFRPAQSFSFSFLDKSSGPMTII